MKRTLLIGFAIDLKREKILVQVKDLEFLFFSDEIGPWEVGQFANWINSVNRE